MQNIFQNGNQKDYPMKALNLLLYLIISLSPLIGYLDNKIRLKLNVGCLKQQNKPAHTSGFGSFSDDITLRNFLFDAVKLTKNADFDKYRYSAYGIGLNRKGSFSSPGSGFGQNVILFGADMSLSMSIIMEKIF